MTPWPEIAANYRDADLLFDFDVVQKVVGLGRAARAQTGLRTRQPLARLLLRVPDDAAAGAAESHADQILEELNVKELEFIARDAELVEYRIKPNLPRIGKHYGRLVPAIRTALTEADGAAIAAAVDAGDSFTIEAGGETLEFGPEDVLVETGSAEGFACAEEGGYLVALDTRLDAALVREGLARELVRTVQDARKQAGLEVSDRIALGISGTKGVQDALAEYRDYVMHETLAVAWAPEDTGDAFVTEKTLEDEKWRIALRVHQLTEG